MLFTLKKKELRIDKVHYFRVLIVVMHVAGIIGILYPPTAQLFIRLTPFNLITSLILTVHFQQNKNRSFWIYGIFAYTIGFLVEVIGVNTGFIFGEYEYGKVLGAKVYNTPILIGANWLIMLLCIGSIINRVNLNTVGKILAASLAMVLMDVIIEPVAIKLKYWTWSDIDVPLVNYVGWFVTSIILFTGYFNLNFDRKNLVATTVLISQLGFFIALYLFLS